jgi:hypothetical protein
MKTKRGILKYSEILIVLVIWLIIFFTPVFLFQRDYSIEWNSVFIAWLGLLPFTLLFLVNHFLLIPFLFFRKSRIAYFLAALSMVIGFTWTTWFLEKGNADFHPKPLPGMQQHPLPQFENQQLPDRPPHLGQQGRNPIPLPPFVNTIIIAILVIGFDAGLRMIFRWSKLEQEKTILEKENIQNQLAFLRNQVSPHFFMNTLNNIHSLIDIDREEAKESIIRLSKLMRHLLYDSESERIPIRKEIDFIKNYLDLMKLRYSDKIKIKLDIPGNIPDKSIPPLLFTSFVENAFKHGISYQNTSFIEIVFLCTDDEIIFKIINSIPPNMKVKKTFGIGIENSRKRLDLIFGSNYELKIDDSIEAYSVKLSIPI